jgi:glycosyltransferase involved in cell wall biosynthesis
LDSIIDQLTTSALQEQVEIVIADNASTDNTTEIVNQYQDIYKNIAIIYFRNEKNLGFDRSFAKLIERSAGTYCLSIGDDDAFFEDTIPMIVEKIKNTDVQFFGLNCWGYDADLKNPLLSHPNLEIKKDIHYKRLSDYIHSIKRYTNLVGIFVGLSTQLFRRDPWVAYVGREQFFDTLAIHMYVNLSVYKDSPFAIIAQPTIKTRSSNIRWDVFAGLETIQGRINSTLEIVMWVRDTFRLPITNISFYVYFYTREYWFTFKEIAKKWLNHIGLGKLILYYRKIR